MGESADNRMMDEAVQRYIDRIAPERRPPFDRLHRLILEAHPDANVVISYGIPTYKVGRRRFFVGAWKHGLSIYGWDEGRDAGFTDRHPELKVWTGNAAAAARGRRRHFRRRIPRPGAIGTRRMIRRQT